MSLSRRALFMIGGGIVVLVAAVVAALVLPRLLTPVPPAEANLPAGDLSEELAQPAAGVEVKVIAGVVGEVRGPIAQPATDPSYLDVALSGEARFAHSLPPEHAAFVFVYEGAMRLGAEPGARVVQTHELAVLGLLGFVAAQDGFRGNRSPATGGSDGDREEHGARLTCLPVISHYVPTSD